MHHATLGIEKYVTPIKQTLLYLQHNRTTMKKTLLLFVFISTIAHYPISTLSAQVPTAAGSYQWVKGFGSANQQSGTDEMVNATKLDHEGNMIVCGRIMGYAHVQGLGGKKDSTLFNRWQNSNNLQGFISKYDCNGNLLWFKELEDSINGSEIYDFVIDSSDNIYAFGKCDAPAENIYWNDSLFSPFSWTPPTQGPIVLLGLNKNGIMRWNYLQPYISNNYFSIAPQSQNSSGSVRPNMMALYKDTISIIGYTGELQGSITLGGVTINTGSSLVRFSTSGHLLDAVLLDSNGYCAGYGIDKDGNYIGIMNFMGPNNQFLDSTYNRSDASFFNQLSTVIKFNRHHVLRHIEANDSCAFFSIDLNDKTGEFNLAGGGGYGKPLYANYSTHLYSTNFGRTGGDAAMHFKDISSFIWGQCPDTTGAGGGFIHLISDVNGDIYGKLPYVDIMKFQNLRLTIPTNQFRDFVVKLSRSNGTLLERFPDLNTSIVNNSNNQVTLQNLLIDQQGNLYMSGNLTSNSVIVGTDTAQYYGGNNDMFIIKYGLPCGSNQSLIAAAAPQNVVANCNGTNIKITWQNISTTADKYYIYRSLSAGSGFSKIDSVSNTTTQYFDNNVSSGTAYWYALSAHNNVGEGYMSTSDSAMKNCSVGINSVTMNEERLTIYPNPCNDELRIRNYELLKVQKVVIENVIGQVVLHPLISSSSNLLMNVVSLPSGIYFLKATDDKGLQHVAKFVKQ